MEAWILDENFRAILLIDSFISFIWTERYIGTGDFELYARADINLLNTIKKEYYVYTPESDELMIVESIQIVTDLEEGPSMVFTGRSLESILDRRIIWTQTNISGNLQNSIKKLLNDNVISPSVSDRKIPNFIFEESKDPAITSLTHDAQYTGDNLLEVLQQICENKHIGFKIHVDANYNFVFKLYSGVDRSYGQSENPYVIFSPVFENILNSNYVESDTTLKNVALVAGEGEGKARKTYTVGSASGLKRRELFVDARDIQSTDSEGNTMSTSTYNAKLKTRGEEKLSECELTQTFEGEVDAMGRQFKYGVDFFIGDVVQFVNEFDMEAKVRVAEYIRSQDTSGYTTYPTFSVIDKEGDK